MLDEHKAKIDSQPTFTIMSRSVRRKITSVPDAGNNNYLSQVLHILEDAEAVQPDPLRDRSILEDSTPMAASGLAVDQAVENSPTEKPTTINEELQKYEICATWLKTLRSPATKHTYAPQLNRFLKFISAEQGKQITPDTFVKMRQQQIRSLVFDYVFHLKDVAKKHAGKPVKGEISVNSIPNYITGIKSFLDFNEIPTPYWKKIKKMLPERVRNPFRAYTIDEVRRMYNHADIFDRLNILLFVAGGERVGGQEGLTFRNVIEIQTPEGITLTNGFKMGMLEIYPESAKDRYLAPLTPECMAAIEATKQYRLQHGENVTLDSPLVRDKFSTIERKGKRSKKINRPKPVKRGAIRLRMKKLQIQAGLPINELQPDHSFRYLFNTTLLNNDVLYSIKEILMGHNLKLDETYYTEGSEASRRKLIVEYLKAIDALTLSPEYNLTKKIAEYEERLKGAAPKDMVADLIIREDALKKQIIDLQTKQDQRDAENYNLKKQLAAELKKELLAELASIRQPNS